MGTSQDERRIYIDFLKAISAIIIIIFHYPHLIFFEAPNETIPFSGILKIPYQYGFVVVELFFLLSGFLLIQDYFSSGRKTQKLQNFLGKKIVRLYPGFFLSSCICFILQIAAYYKSGSFVLGLGTDLSGIFLDLTVLKSGLFNSAVPLNVPAWFLTPLFVCYFLFWMVFWGNEKSNGIKFIISGILMLIGIATLLNEWDMAIFNMRMGRGLSAFFSGVLLGGYCAHISGKSPYRALFGLIVMVLSLVMINANMSGNLYVSATFMFVALIYTLENSKFIEPILTHKTLQMIWTPLFAISYNLFLSHYPILTGIAMINRIFPLTPYVHTVWFFCSYILLSILLAKFIKMLGKHLQLSIKKLLFLFGDE